MNRNKIPFLGMVAYGNNHLSAEGFVSMPLPESYSLNPLRALPHYHDFFQVTLFHGNGFLMHDFRETEVSGSTLFFLSPGQVHTIVPGEGSTGTIVSFTREFCDNRAGFLLELPFFYENGGVPWLKVPAEQSGWVSSIFQDLQQEYNEARPGAQEVFRSLLRIVLVKAARWSAELGPARDESRAAALARKFQHSVERHYLEWTALEPYAKELGVTVNHLNDQVRDKTGESAGEHIRLRRLLDAKRNLLHSTLSVSEIGYRLGFKDPSYFSRFFRRYENLTPVDFRAQIREKYQKGPA